MSEIVSYKGTIKKILFPENVKSIEDKLNFFKEKYKDLNYETDEISNGCVYFTDYKTEDKLIQIYNENTKQYDWYEILEFDDLTNDDFCSLTDGNFGEINFHTSFYTGGTSLREMLEKEINIKNI